MKQLTENPEKMAIVERLVKDGHIDFAEAIALLETEPAYTWPIIPTPPYQPEPFPWWQQLPAIVNIDGPSATTEVRYNPNDPFCAGSTFTHSIN